MAYTNSPMVVYTNLSPNNSGQRTHPIDRISPHCVVGQVTAESLGDWFAKKSTQASSNYGIDKNGRVGLYVEEKNRSWCTSSKENDNRAVTIECASNTKDPYAMNDCVYESLIELCIDICRRNGKSKLIWMSNKSTALNYSPKSNEMVITVHRWYADKPCPGDWLFNRLGDLAAKVTAALSNTNSQVKSEPVKQNSAINITAEAVLNVAKSQIGYHEKASNSNLDDFTTNSGSGNYTKYARDFDQKYPNWYNGKKNGYAWCDMFVDWCFLTAFGYEKALELLCQPEKSAGAGCIYSLQYYKNKGQFHTSNPKPGDQIFFGPSISSANHTGIVEKVDSKYVYTIEGNSSDQVIRRTYSLVASNILGYGRPNYDASGSASGTQETMKPASEQYIVATKSDPLNCRATPSASGTILGTLAKGAIVTADQVINGWVHVTDGSITGWALGDYLQAYTAPATVEQKEKSPETTKEEEDENEMIDVSKLTDKECYHILERAQKYAQKLGIPVWAEDKLQSAIDSGITDGSNPCCFATRYEAAIMANRAKT